MSGPVPHLLVAAALTVSIALISGGRWPHYVMGAGFTLALFVMLLASTHGQEGATVGWPAWTTFASASVVTLLLGSLLLWIGDRDNGAWWGAAAIMAAAVSWPVTHLSRSRDAGPEAG